MKKVIVVFTILVFFLSAALIVPMQKASANPIITIAGGTVAKQLIKGIAEKAGIALTTKQLDNVVAAMNRKSLDGDTKVSGFIENINSKTSAGAGSKSGLQKYVLEPLAWVSGVDTIMDIIGMFADGAENQEEVPLYTQCADKSMESSSGTVSLVGKYYFDILSSGNDLTRIVYDYPNGIVYKHTDGQSWYIKASSGGGTWQRYKKAATGTVFSLMASGTISSSGSATGVANGTPQGLTVANCGYVPTSSDVVDMSNYDNDVITNYDNDTYYNNVNNITYPMELDIPDSPATMEGVWNTADSNITGGTFYVIDSDGGDVIISPPAEGELVPTAPIKAPSNFFELMGDMGAKLVDTYNGVVKFFSDSVNGMQALIIGSAGMVAFMTGFFDIFPTEFTTVLTVGFMMGFIMFFLGGSCPMWEIPDYSGVTDFWTTFYTTFAELFRFIIDYELHFPEPIGTITVFYIGAFFLVLDMLVSLVQNVAFRGKKDDD